MKRREFLKLCISGAFLALLSKNAIAEKKPGKPLKEAMFWKRVD